MKIPYSDTSTFLEDYEAAVQWLTKVTGKPHSRWMTYLSELRAYGPAFETGDFRKVRHNSLHGLLNTYFEAHMLVEVHQAFADTAHENLTRTLKSAVKGKFRYDEDGADVAGRNYMFELQMAATIKRLGYAIDFNGDYDCGIRHIPGIIAVECKRPKSKDSVMDVIEQSVSQINRRVTDSKDAFCGLSAVNVDLVVNGDFKMIEAEDERMLHQDLMGSIEAVVDEYKDRLRGLYLGGNCLGVLFQLRAMSRIPDHGYPIVTRTVALVDLVEPGHKNFTYMRDISRRFSATFQVR